MKNKPDLKQHVQFDSPSRGCGMGCWSIGCMGVCGIGILLCVAAYYSVFHSSLPLRVFEAAIEEQGDIEIEGLSGSLSSGFTADELRFKTVDDHWSHLNDIKFKYEGDISIFGTDSLIIKELSVAGGTIYADWDPDENELDFDPNIKEEIDQEMRELDNELREEVGQSTPLKELRIDLVSITNLKIVNPTTQLEIKIDELKFEGFEWREGELESLGKFLVRSSQLDLATVPSVEFAQMKNAERFEGVLRAEADHRLKTDVPFVFDFGVDDELDISLKSELFDGRLCFSQLLDKATLNYVDFSPSDFIELDNGAVLPSNVNMKVDFDGENAKGPTQVNADGTFMLGKSKFGNLGIEQSDEDASFVIAFAEVNGKSVRASIKIDGPNTPWWNMQLESEGFDSQDELWAQTVYGKPLVQLSESQKAAVVASLPKPDPELEQVAEQKTTPEQNSAAEIEPDALQSPVTQPDDPENRAEADDEE